MNSKALIFLITMFCTAQFVPPSVAQTTLDVDQCTIEKTKIVTLDEPAFKSPIIMQSSYKLAGIQNIVDFEVAYNLKSEDKSNYIVLGNFSKSQGGAESASRTYPFLTKLNHKGEVIWDVHENHKNDLEAVALLKNKFGYVVLGNIADRAKGRGFYLTQYDAKGKKLRQMPFYIEGANAYAKSFDFTHDGKGYLISIDRVSPKNKRDATVYRVNIDGFSPWDKKYALDEDTIFENIHRLSTGGHIVTGSIKKQDGRVAAWLFNLREKGSAGWQKSYLRGLNASLHHAIELKNGGFLVAGHTQSFYGDKKSAWVMQVDRNAAPIWQRFYTGDYDFHIKDIRVDENNLTSILMDAQPFYKKGVKPTVQLKGHLRLLTLSPRGDMLYHDSFQGGDNAYATKLLTSETSEHTIMAMKQYFPPKGIEDRNPINEGWLFFAPSFADYVDPCAPPKES